MCIYWDISNEFDQIFCEAHRRLCEKSWKEHGLCEEVVYVSFYGGTYYGGREENEGAREGAEIGDCSAWPISSTNVIHTAYRQYLLAKGYNT